MHYPQQQQQQQQQFHYLPQQPQQQHPLLAAVASGNNYAYNNPRGYYPGHVHSLRPAAGADTSAYGVYIGSSPAEYGASASGSGYDYHHPAPAPHHPTGGANSYHVPAGTGYGAPPPPIPVATKVKKDSGGTSSLTALTLLSFFFFVNLLQGCIKDQMAAMNPTVMVMTVGGARNRFNKLAEMNSREQSASSVASTNAFSSGASIVMKPADLVASATSSLVRSTPPPFMLKSSPYSQSEGNLQPLTNYNYNNNNNANKHSNNYKNDEYNNNSNNNNKNNHDSGPEFYDSHAYPNQTHYSVMSNDKNHNQPSDYQQHEHATSSQAHSYPWSYGTSVDKQISSPHRQHGSSTYSSWSTTPNRISGSKYFEDVVDDVDDDHDDDHRGDSYYTRIN